MRWILSAALIGAVTFPVQAQWMQGTPPDPAAQVRVDDQSFMAHPRTQWSFANWRRLFPTLAIAAPGPVSTLPRALRRELDAITFLPGGSDAPLTWGEAFAVNHSDGVLVLHRGRIVYERFAPHFGPGRQHIAFSVSKSFVGLLAEALIAEGTLDPRRTVASYVPEVAASGYGDATVRDLLDMTAGVKFSEDFGDANSDFARYLVAAGVHKAPTGSEALDGILASLVAIERAGPHGQAMRYRTADADMLGWVLARATGVSLADLMATRFWAPLGMEAAGYFHVDARGTPYAGGGLNLALHDLARFGEMVRLNGRFNGRQIVPEAAVASIRGGGDRAKFPISYKTMPGGSYRSQWWVFHDANGTFMARGVHGQLIWIDPVAEVTIVRLASHPIAPNTPYEPTTLPAFRAIADHLARKTRRDPASALPAAASQRPAAAS